MSIDYSQNSLQELIDVSRRLDRQKHPDQYDQVIRAIRLRYRLAPKAPLEIGEGAKTSSLLVRLCAHGLAGFLSGITGHVLFVFIVGMLLAFLSAPSSSLLNVLFGGSRYIVVLCTAYGIGRAVRRPIHRLSHPSANAGLLALGILLFAVGICAFFAIMLSKPGYC